MTAGGAGAVAPGRVAQAGWLLAALLAAAALVDLGGFHALEHGDSIVPVLVSLLRWTPFYWEQERFGMLVPLLAAPVRDPLWNLLLQRALCILGGLAAVVLLARHALAVRDWPLCGAVAVAGLLALPSGGWAFEYLADQPYGVSLALALAGLAVAEPGPAGRRSAWRLAAGLLLVLLAHWVNATIGVVLGLLALARAAEDLATGEPRREVAGRLLVDAGLLAAGLVAGLAMFRAGAAWLGHTRRVAEGFLPAVEWPGSWATLLGRTVADEGAWLAALALSAVAGAGLLSLPSLRPVRRQALWRAATLAAAALGWFAFTGTLEWVAGSAHHWRYVIPSMLLLHLAAASLLAEPLSRTARLAGPALAAALLAIPVAAVAAWGPPSLAGVRADLARVTGRHAEEVRLARCDLMTGDYWSVWPTLWRIEQLNHERGEGRRVYGVVHRGTPTMPAWAGRPREALRICRPRTAVAERDGERWLRMYRLWPVEVLERWPTVDVLAPAGAPPQAGPDP
jgi:hypothetical protein